MRFVTKTYAINNTIACYEHSKHFITILALHIGQPHGELLAMVPGSGTIGRRARYAQPMAL